MKIAETIKEIRNRLNLSQKEMAAVLGVTFATVNRWENDRCEPTQIAIKGIKSLCEKNHIDFSEFEGNLIFIGTEKVTLKLREVNMGFLT